MDNDQQAIAEFWARLASIHSLEELREGERLLLVEDFKNKVLLWLEASLREDHHNYPFDLTFGLDAPLSRALTLLHEDARKIIGDLLDGKPVEAPSKAMPRLTWALKDGILQEQAVDSPYTISRLPVPEITSHYLVELVQTVRLRPFPFRRCPVCQSVFVRAGKKMYCSAICTIRAAEDARKDSKREYMREYMAKKRKQTKARQGRKED